MQPQPAREFLRLFAKTAVLPDPHFQASDLPSQRRFVATDDSRDAGDRYSGFLPAEPGDETSTGRHSVPLTRQELGHTPSLEVGELS